jgi:hypothetical protein
VKVRVVGRVDLRNSYYMPLFFNSKLLSSRALVVNLLCLINCYFTEKGVNIEVILHWDPVHRLGTSLPVFRNF